MNLYASPQVELSVSIVVHDSSLMLLQRVLKSLQASGQVARQAGCLRRMSVYLVDNASSKAYRDQLEVTANCWPPNDFFHLHHSLQAINLGFGGGHNTVLDTLGSDYHLVLNPDVELEEGTLRAGLSALLENEDIALLSPKVFGTKGDQEFLCKRYPSVLALLLRGFAPQSLKRLFHRQLAAYEMRDLCAGEGQVTVPIASGCFMLARTAALRAAGGFNEKFFLYFEDFDLSLRLANQGRLVFDPAMQIVHHGGYAARKGGAHLKYFVRSGLRFFNQHGWRWI
jgi:GT2 family glycosyltransferase